MIKHFEKKNVEQIGSIYQVFLFSTRYQMEFIVPKINK